jgi:hypothetical protein
VPLGSVNLILNDDPATAVATVQSHESTIQYIQAADFDGNVLRPLVRAVDGITPRVLGGPGVFGSAWPQIGTALRSISTVGHPAAPLEDYLTVGQRMLSAIALSKFNSRESSRS